VLIVLQAYVNMPAAAMPAAAMPAVCPQVLRVGENGDGRLGIMYTAAQQPATAAAAAGNGDAPHVKEGSKAPAMLLADALVLAAGGFAASKQMLQVCRQLKVGR
jgi:hypothetical protein